MKLELFHGLAHESGRDMFTLPGPDAMRRKTIETFRGEGYPNRVVGVNVRNVGRLPVTVDAISVIIQPTDVVYKPLKAALGPPLPHRVEAGSKNNGQSNHGSSGPPRFPSSPTVGEASRS